MRPQTRILFMAFSALAGCTLSACGGSDEEAAAQPAAAAAPTPTPPPTPAPAPTPAPSPSPAPAPAPTSSATLTWTVPALNDDGTPLTLSGVAGYRIRYGTSASNLARSVDVMGASVTRYTVPNLTVGSTYYFSVLTVTNDGAVSLGSSAASVKVF